MNKPASRSTRHRVEADGAKDDGALSLAKFNGVYAYFNIVLARIRVGWCVVAREGMCPVRDCERRGCVLFVVLAPRNGSRIVQDGMDGSAGEGRKVGVSFFSALGRSVF